jgi:hypothetical protein
MTQLLILQVTAATLPLSGCYWIRSEPNNKYSTYSYIPDSEKCGDKYTLTSADAGCYISFQQSHTIESTTSETGTSSDKTAVIDESGNVSDALSVCKVSRAKVSVGPVLPGPPRLLDLTITGDATCGSKVYAVADYIGGTQGPSEYWWFRINGGKRQQMSEPQAISVGMPHPFIDASEEVVPACGGGKQTKGLKDVGEEGEGKCPQDSLSVENRLSPSASNLAATSTPTPFPDPSNTAGSINSTEQDPRVYVLCAEDVGCTLKVKCRPIRQDGYRGEVFTSKASATVK